MALQTRRAPSLAAADHRRVFSPWQRWKPQHVPLARDENLKLSFNGANSPVLRLGKCLVCRSVLRAVSRGLVVGLFPPASPHAAVTTTTTTFPHPQGPAGKEAQSFKGALSWASSPEQRQNSRQLSWEARSCCAHPLATSVPSICCAWLCASLPRGNKSVREIKEPDSEAGGVTDGPACPVSAAGLQR